MLQWQQWLPKLFAKNKNIHLSSAYFDNIYGQLNELCRSFRGILSDICSTKSLIMTNFSQKFASEVTFVGLACTVGKL